MTQAIAFECTFSDWRLIKTRGVVSISFEVPIEKADVAYKVLGGMPDHSSEKWFAIARLNPKSADPKERPEKKSWQEMPPVQQAGMLCDDPLFQKFMRETSEFTHNDIPLMVRQHCGVESRKGILPGTDAGNKWDSLVSDYRAWVREVEIVP